MAGFSRFKSETFWLRLVAVTQLALLVVICLSGSAGKEEGDPGGKVVTAEKFILQHGDGKELGEWGITEAGRPYLILRKPGAEEEGVGLTAGKHGGTIHLQGATQHVELSTREAGGFLVMGAGPGKIRLGLVNHAQDGPALIMIDRKDVYRLVAEVKHDKPGLKLLDEDGEELFSKP